MVAPHPPEDDVLPTLAPMIPRLASRLGVVVLGAGLATAACGGGTASDSGGLAVRLADFSIGLATAQVPAGEVHLAITNEGAVVHEVEVFRVPDGVDPGALPVSGGVADTASQGLTIVDEVEDIVPSTGVRLTVDLQPGRYALICNLPAHYQAGMHATLTVD